MTPPTHEDLQVQFHGKPQIDDLQSDMLRGCGAPPPFRQNTMNEPTHTPIDVGQPSKPAWQCVTAIDTGTDTLITLRKRGRYSVRLGDKFEILPLAGLDKAVSAIGAGAVHCTFETL